MTKTQLQKIKELHLFLKERNMALRSYDAAIIFFRKRSSHNHHFLQFHLGQTHMNGESPEIREVMGRPVYTKDNNSFWLDENDKLRKY